MDNINVLIPASQIEIEASEWLARMDTDKKLSQQDLADLKAWMNRSPAHRAQLNRLIAFWQEANVLTELSFPLPGKSSMATQSQSLSDYWPRVGAFAE